MTLDAFHVGQYVEFLEGPFKEEEALVWRIGDEYLELVREEDFQLVKAPYYVAIEDADSKIRLLQPKQEPSERRPLVCLPPRQRSCTRPTTTAPRACSTGTTL